MTATDYRGSQLQCLLLTSFPRYVVARTLMDVSNSLVTIDPEHDVWMPKGLLQPSEAQLHTAPDFVPEEQRRVLQDWWLRVPHRANTPNWDLVSTCTIEGKRGLLLVEAKAHTNELEIVGKRSDSNAENHEQIGEAVMEANKGLDAAMLGWLLKRDAHYQLSNRFAWAWRLASLKIPIVLVYLGFRNTAEMSDRGRPFTSQEDWEQSMRTYSTGIVPEAAWGSRLDISGTPIFPLIRSLEIQFRP